VRSASVRTTQDILSSSWSKESSVKGRVCVWGGAVAAVAELGPQWMNRVAGEHWLGGDGGPQCQAAASQEGSRPLSKRLLDTDSPGQAVQRLC